MTDFLDVLAHDARETINQGYYEVPSQISTNFLNLKNAIIKSTSVPIITEIKTASPSMGSIREKLNPGRIAKVMENCGAVGISVLTEPKHFNGSLFSLIEARKRVRIPILMKDIIISPIQLEIASKIGANAVLLIQALFDRGYCKYDLHEMIARAHSENLEVLLETHNEKEFRSAIVSETDLVGINNRDLGTLKVDLGVTKRILEKDYVHEKIVVSESGIRTVTELRFLHECGAQAFLIGSAIMIADKIERKLKEFMMAF